VYGILWLGVGFAFWWELKHKKRLASCDTKFFSQLESNQESAIERAASNEFWNEFLKFNCELKPVEKAILWFKFAEDLSIHLIAERLGMPKTNTHRLYTDIIMRLKLKLQSHAD
jgi:DNA-directed RNA polymerase specialized sigma24 family protein